MPAAAVIGRLKAYSAGCTAVVLNGKTKMRPSACKVQVGQEKSLLVGQSFYGSGQASEDFSTGWVWHLFAVLNGIIRMQLSDLENCCSSA